MFGVIYICLSACLHRLFLQASNAELEKIYVEEKNALKGHSERMLLEKNQQTEKLNIMVNQLRVSTACCLVSNIEIMAKSTN